VSFNFTSASLTGDAKQIIELLFSNFYIERNSFIDLLYHKEMLPHRWYLAFIIGIPIGILEIFNFPIELNLKMSLISFAVAYLFTFLYLITPIIIFSSMENKDKNKNVAIFLIITFFGTSYLQFVNFYVQENIVIIFFVIAMCLLRSQNIIFKALLFFFIFSIPLIKIYLLPLSAYLIYLNYDIKLNWKKIIFITFLCGLVSCLPYFIQGYLYHLKDIHEISNGFIEERINDLKNINFLVNLFNTIFSTSHGLLLNYHIFFISIIFIIISDFKNNLISTIILIFYLIFFSFFKFWHGDGVGSRYLAPVMLLFIYNICHKLKDFQINNVTKILALIVISLNQAVTEFKTASIRSYLERNISLERKTVVNLNENNFPYNNINLIPMYFQNKILIHKLIDRPVDYNFENTKLEIEYIYPRTLLMTIIHVINHPEQKLKEKYLPKFIYSKESMLKTFLYVVKFILHFAFILFLYNVFFILKRFYTKS
jgi:hypothetical protein